MPGLNESELWDALNEMEEAALAADKRGCDSADPGENPCGHYECIAILRRLAGLPKHSRDLPSMPSATELQNRQNWE